MPFTCKSYIGALIFIFIYSLSLYGRYFFEWASEQGIALQLTCVVTLIIVSLIFIRFPKKSRKGINRNEFHCILIVLILTISSFLSTHHSYNLLWGIGSLIGIYLFLNYFFNTRNIKVLFLSISFCGIVEAIYGIWRFYYSSLRWAMGHFDNPAGFAGMMIAVLPFAFYFIKQTEKRYTFYGIMGSIIIILALCYSSSRSGIVAGVIIAMFYFLRKIKDHYFKRINTNKSIVLSSIGVALILGAIYLYCQKKESANGRLLIWICSINMVIDKPLLGHGVGAFDSEFMNYQAQYFKKTPYSRYAQLADNTKQTFNEYLKGFISIGIIGMFTIIALIVRILKFTLKRITLEKEAAIASLCGIAVFGIFSYPLYYVAIVIIIALNLHILIACQIRRVQLPRLVEVLSGAIFIATTLISIFYTSKTIKHEIVWQKLKENTVVSDTELLSRYRDLYKSYNNPLFLYNCGAVMNSKSAYNQSRLILTECEKYFNDSDLQMIQANNYYHLGDYSNAERCALLASHMCPNRFTPLFQLMEIYNKQGQKEKELNVARSIIHKEIKVHSNTVLFIIKKARQKLETDRM